MPNWCENELIVKGTRELLMKFKEFAKGENGEFDFNKFVPYPEEWKKLDEAYWGGLGMIDALSRKLDETSDEKERETIKSAIAEIRRSMPEKDAFNNGGYEWCVENWGTKWNADDPRVFDAGKFLVYSFATAWTPPIPVIHKASEMFPELTFTLRYKEDGMGFRGLYRVVGGVVVKELYCEYY